MSTFDTKIKSHFLRKRCATIKYTTLLSVIFMICVITKNKYFNYFVIELYDFIFIFLSRYPPTFYSPCLQKYPTKLYIF